MKPYDSISDLFKIVEEYQVLRGDPILAWSKENLKVLLTGPLFGAVPQEILVKAEQEGDD